MILWDYINDTINFIIYFYWLYFIFKLRYLFKGNKFHYKKEDLPITYWLEDYPEITAKIKINKLWYPLKVFIIILFITTSIFILFFGFYYIQLSSFTLITFISSFIYLIAYKIYISLILIQDTTFGVLIILYGFFFDKDDDKKVRITNTIFYHYVQRSSVIVTTIPFFLFAFFFYHFLMFIPYHFLCLHDNKRLNINYTIYDFYTCFKKQTYFFKKVGSIKLNEDQWGSVIAFRLNLDYVEGIYKLLGNLFYIFILINFQILILLVGVFYLIITISFVKSCSKKERINAITYMYLNRNGEFKAVFDEGYIEWLINKFKL